MSIKLLGHFPRVEKLLWTLNLKLGAVDMMMQSFSLGVSVVCQTLPGELDP